MGFKLLCIHLNTTDYFVAQVLSKVLTNTCIVVSLWQDDDTYHPGQAHWYFDNHQQTNEGSFPVIVSDVSRLDSEAGDEEDEENNIEKGKEVIPGGERTGRRGGEPLGGDDDLDEDAEEEEERLICGREVDTSVERDEENKLDEERSVDENIGEPGSQSNN